MRNKTRLYNRLAEAVVAGQEEREGNKSSKIRDKKR